MPAPLTAAAPTEVLPASMAPTTLAPIVPPAPAPAPASVASTDDDFDPRDEFPEHPPSTGTTRKWFVLLLLLLAIAGGALAWYNSRPEMRTVPELAGMQEGVALNAIAGDFQGVLAQESSEVVDAGDIIRTDPLPGTELKKGAVVTLYASTGPAPRVLPELAGMTVVEATDQLDGLGLVVEIGEPVFDETAVKDVVLTWTVPDSPTLVAGGTVTKGTAVRLIASAGPAPRAVPDLTGLTLADATKALAAVQLGIKQAPDEFSDTVASGQIVRQNPATGTQVERDSAVAVVVSKGHTPIVMPADLGVPLDKKSIVTALRALGFGKVTTKGDPAAGFVGLTVGGKPTVAGAEYPWGSAIVVEFAPTPPPTIPTPTT